MEVKKNTSTYILLIFITLSIISFFLCIVLSSNDDKALLCILPISYLISIIVFNKNFIKINTNISILMIETLFFIRLVLLPTLYSFTINIQLFEGNVVISQHFSKACFLMAYEFFMVQIVIMFHYLLKKKKDGNIQKRKEEDLIASSSKINISNYIVLSLSLFVIVSFVFFGNYISKFKTIFELGDYNFTVGFNENSFEVGTFGRIIKTLFTMCFQIFRILLPAYLLKKMKIKEKRYSGFLLILFCLLQFMFLTSTFAEAIVSCLCLILYYMKLFPEKRKKTIKLLLISTVGTILLYFSVRYFVRNNASLYAKTNPIVYTAQIINAYFTGVDNVAAIFNVEKLHRFEALKADIIGAIPFNSTIFGSRGNKLQYFYNLYNRSYGQIPPTIGTGYYYFGIILSPIISMIFTKISLLYYDKSEKIRKSFKYVSLIFCSIIFALGLIMYSPAITLSWYFGWGIPMIIITIFNWDN